MNSRDHCLGCLNAKSLARVASQHRTSLWKPTREANNTSHSIISLVEREIASISQWLKDNSPPALAAISQNVTAIRDELAQLRLLQHEPQSIHEKVDRILAAQTAQPTTPSAHGRPWPPSCPLYPRPSARCPPSPQNPQD